MFADALLLLAVDEDAVAEEAFHGLSLHGVALLGRRLKQFSNLQWRMDWR